VGYQADHDRRTVLVRVAPIGATPPRPPSPSRSRSLSGSSSLSGNVGDAPPQVRWQTQGVRGAAILGTFTMGTGTTLSRPGFDQFASIWHGFLEPLVDAWAHLRRLEANRTTAASRPLCPRYDVYVTDEVLGPSQTWARGYLAAFWRAFASPGARGLQSVLDLLEGAAPLVDRRNRSGGKGGVRPWRATAAALAAGAVAPWAQVASAPMTCYALVVVGAPCCSRFPFNGRGGEDLLGPFGDCMLEAHHHAQTAASGSEAVGPFRRAAATSAAAMRAVILDRDECDRRLSNPLEVAAGLKSLGLGQVCEGTEDAHWACRKRPRSQFTSPRVLCSVSR
jgi:hypothetical protein